MSLLSRHFENFFNDPFFDEFDLMIRPRALGQSSKKNEFGIKCDVKETPTNFIISADLPGMKKEDIKMHVKDGMLIIEAEMKEEKEEKHETYHMRERRFGRFERKFRLPNNVDVNKIQAEYKDGVLCAKIEKKEENSMKIEIQ